jgi:hypothetical protein
MCPRCRVALLQRRLSASATTVSTQQLGPPKTKKPSIFSRVAFRRLKSAAPEVPYDLLETILRLSVQELERFPTSLCLVSKAWNSVATDLLYESLSPHSYHCFLLLLRSLSTGGYHGLSLRMKVRNIRLPMISRGKYGYSEVIHIKSLFVDQSGIPTLIPRHTTTRPTILRAGYKRDSQLFKEFTRFVSLCPNIRTLSFSFPVSHSLTSGWANCSIVKTFRSSTLRRLTLCGIDTIRALVEGIKDNQQINMPTLPQLEVLTVFDSSIDPGILDQLKRCISGDKLQILLPNLERLVLENTRATSLCLLSFLGVLEKIAPRLTSVALLNLRFMRRNRAIPNSILIMGPQRIKHLVLDMSTLYLLYPPEAATDGTLQGHHFGLSHTAKRTLESFELCLSGCQHHITHSLLTVEAMYQYGPPMSWTVPWIETLPATLKKMRFVIDHHPTFVAPPSQYNGDSGFEKFLKSGTDGASFFKRDDWKDLKMTFEERWLP